MTEIKIHRVDSLTREPLADQPEDLLGPTEVELDPKTIRRMIAVIKREGITAGQFIRRAILTHLDEVEPEK